jgi:hypothetical protein
VVTTIGNYTGGELVFLKIGFKIPIQPRDIVIFEGTRLFHKVNSINPEEIRTSINMYMSRNVFIPGGIE